MSEIVSKLQLSYKPRFLLKAGEAWYAVVPYITVNVDNRYDKGETR
jgi:hypothetical protein